MISALPERKKPRTRERRRRYDCKRKTKIPSFFYSPQICRKYITIMFSTAAVNNVVTISRAIQMFWIVQHCSRPTHLRKNCKFKIFFLIPLAVEFLKYRLKWTNTNFRNMLHLRSLISKLGSFSDLKQNQSILGVYKKLNERSASGEEIVLLSGVEYRMVVENDSRYVLLNYTYFHALTRFSSMLFIIKNNSDRRSMKTPVADTFLFFFFGDI